MTEKEKLNNARQKIKELDVEGVCFYYGVAVHKFTRKELVRLCSYLYKELFKK